MDKISVIIPTMWKVKEFTKELIKLSEIDSVGEIIIIDNTENQEKIKLPKVIHILEGKNTFINPAWNKGYRISKYDKLCFMNDDVQVENEIFDKVMPSIKEEIGMIGLHEFHGNGVWEDEPVGTIISRNEVFRENKSLLFKLIESEKNHRRPGYACFWFIHKKSYVEIPDELKVWNGDDWIYYMNIKNGKQNYSMMNVDIVGKPSQTTGLAFLDKVKRQDQINWFSIWKNFYK